jgi:hypothetical protein
MHPVIQDQRRSFFSFLVARKIFFLVFRTKIWSQFYLSILRSLREIDAASQATATSTSSNPILKRTAFRVTFSTQTNVAAYSEYRQ